MDTIKNNHKWWAINCLITLIFGLFLQQARAEVTGEALYMQNCAVCHADDGSGAMPGVKDINENRAWEKMSDNKLLSRLIKGISTPGAAITMPPRGGNPDIKDRELLKIIAFMRKGF